MNRTNEAKGASRRNIEIFVASAGRRVCCGNRIGLPGLPGGYSSEVRLSLYSAFRDFRNRLLCSWTAGGGGKWCATTCTHCSSGESTLDEWTSEQQQSHINSNSRRMIT